MQLRTIPDTPGALAVVVVPNTAYPVPGSTDTVTVLGFISMPDDASQTGVMYKLTPGVVDGVQGVQLASAVPSSAQSVAITKDGSPSGTQPVLLEFFDFLKTYGGS